MSVVIQRSRFVLSSSACEALKWLALASMLVDHVNTAFFAREVAWMIPVGRFAMPVFSLLLGYNMARPGADHARLLKRLLLVGLIAQPFHAAALWGGSLIPLNVLFTFAAGVAVVMAADRNRWALVGAVLLASLVLVDYSVSGVALMVTAYLYFRSRSWVGLVALALAVLGLCFFNGNVWALAGVATFASAPAWELWLPRWRWAFWVAYPAHLAVLALLVAVL